MTRFKVLSVFVSLLVLAVMITGCNFLNPTTSSSKTTKPLVTVPTTTTTKPPAPKTSSLEILSFSNVQSAIVGQYFVRQLPAAGGVPPYTWTLVSGDLPPGLTLNTNGRISGTPTTAGTYKYTVRLTDSKGTYVEADYTQNVVDSGGTLQFVVLWAQMLPYYEDQIIGYVPFVQGGKEPWTFEIDGLPDGITFDPETGFIQGTTTDATVIAVTITVRDADGNIASNSPTTFAYIVNPVKPAYIGSGHSPYEGTYTGIFAYEYEDFSNPPKTITGGFRLSITLSQPLTANGVTVLQITHADCSDPYFGAQFGCTPNFASVATLPADPPTLPGHPSQAGMGIVIFFPNGATLATTNFEGSLNVGYDGMMLSNSLDTSIQGHTWVASSFNSNAPFLPQASTVRFKSWGLSWSFGP